MTRFLGTLFVLACCAACAASKVSPATTTTAPPATPETDSKSPAAPPPLPQGIEVRSTAPVMATIDPKTLKVTYKKGADSRVFADEMVKAWAGAMGNLQECQQQLKAATEKK